ncbi:MAG: ACP phosphodiesterase [Flavobacteriales bacterium]
MNFLAHFYLAYGDSDRLAGQFIADAVKGKNFTMYSEGIQQGIWQHREIDMQTDGHPAVLHLRSLIRPEVGLLSSVAIDVYFDHILARRWSTYHAESLETFAAGTYSQLLTYQAVMPERMQTTLKYMAMHDWLSQYAKVEGIQRSLLGLSKRVSGGEKLLMASGLLEEMMTEIERAFDLVFPDLVSATKRRILETNQPKLDPKHYI